MEALLWVVDLEFQALKSDGPVTFFSVGKKLRLAIRFLPRKLATRCISDWKDLVCKKMSCESYA